MHALALLLSFALPPQEEVPASPFPPSTALAERISPEGLQALSDVVQSFVDQDEIVGAELLVVVNGRTILHEGYGWRDRERDVSMEPGGVFCVRSMTKPLIGASIWMLIDERKLELDDRVAEYLPAFDVDGKREITIEQLLTHTSGLPLSLILTRDPRSLESVRAVADLSGACELEFAPGSAFNYSDQGTDTLTAVIEVVTGAPAEDFVRARLLEPLAMTDTTCVMTEGHALRERACSAYMGSPGAWTRFWSPADAALFPVFLGSQALYSTAVDYARFLDLYVRKGRATDARLLRPLSVRRTLEPGPHVLANPTGLPGVRADYGMLMQVWTKEGEKAARELVAFGHSGSDGTYAWAFPEQRALVLYLTQSRGTPTGLRVEEVLGELLLGVPYDPLQAAPPLEQYLGYYWEGEGDVYRAIVRDGADLALEVAGRAVAPLDYLGEDRWKLRPEPTTVLEFDRDDAGAVVGYHIGEHVERRFTPRADLPAAADLAARVAAAHRMERLTDAGVVHLRGRVEIPALDRSGGSSMWMAWPNRWRADETIGDTRGSMAFDGTTLRRSVSVEPAEPVEGRAAQLLLQEDPFLRFGDWRRNGTPLTVVQELGADDNHVWLVRAGDCSAPAATMYVDAATGRLRRVDSLTYLDGMGVVGQQTTFTDFREVAGALLPFKIETKLANPMIGKIVSTYETAETGVDVHAGWFELAPEAR